MAIDRIGIQVSHTQLRPTRAVVDLGAIAHNVRNIKALVGKGVRLMAVVKADAYGHGLVPVARTALGAGAEWLGVALPEEGVALRAAGITAPILVLGPTVPAQAQLVAGAGLDQMVHSTRLAEALSRAARKARRTLPVHLKVETGMGRVGVPVEEVAALAGVIGRLPGLRLGGVMTHFAAADAPEAAHAREQLRHFHKALASAHLRAGPSLLRHAANSAATFALPEARLDLVRIGIALYGCPPSPDASPPIPLRPALTLETRVAQVRWVPAGTTVSYGCTFVAPARMRIATLPVGYGDGFPRLLSNRGAVLLRGKRAPVVGRVCMDMVMVDVTGIPEVSEEDPVVLLGAQGTEVIPAEEWAGLADTISYEILCGITPRVPRVYVGEGAPGARGEAPPGERPKRAPRSRRAGRRPSRRRAP
ncbi:MAG TPA: alanine racemase [Candidatus Methylomirabilis sp.]|jgi:alanine racemase|nr:alanine racemase [Candidatus Methylomirabilis sp.]